MKSQAEIRPAVMRLCAWLSIAAIAAAPVPVRADDHKATPAATATPIQHVVVVFQENVSFDHYFATYPNAVNGAPGEPEFTPAPGSPSVNGLSGPLLTDNPNSQPPFRLTRAQAVTCDQDHSYTDEQRAFNHGLMDQFVETVGVGAPGCPDFGHGKGLVMGYYDGNTTTALWNYAQHFAMSDNSYGTTFGPSTPGALNLVAGQTHGATLTQGSATGNVAAGSVIGDPRPSLALDDCTIRTASQITMTGQNVGDLLNAKGLTWGWFQGGFQPTSHNPDGTAVCAAAHANIAGASTADYIPHHEPFQYFPQTANPHHLPPVSLAAIGHTDQANHQYDIAAFFAALSAGNLPAVSYLKAPAFEDGHAGYSDPIDEQTFLVNTINALMKSPFWKSTAIFIAYDDSDGWYDHQMGPIVNQSTTPADFLTGAGTCGNGAAFPFQGRCGYGPRLPLLVISPFARTNFVDHNVSDQSSILRFIEDNWDLGRIGNSSTDAIAGSLLTMFDFSREGEDHNNLPILDPATGVPIHGH